MEKEYTCSKKEHCCYYHENNDIVNNKACAACIYREKVVEDTIQSTDNYNDNNVIDKKSKKKLILSIVIIIFLFGLVTVLNIAMSNQDNPKNMISERNENTQKSNNEDTQNSNNDNSENNDINYTTSTEKLDSEIVVESPEPSDIEDDENEEETKPVIGENCKIDYIISSTWDNGAVVDIVLYNENESALKNWKLEWKFDNDQKIEEIWNAKFEQDNNNIFMSGAEYNLDIPAKGSVSFGFKLYYTGLNSIPKEFKLNNVLCSVN